ncbi:unnamed protein product [Haemonchus placei]|uniref:Ovule protein n=1 Tax=Haemonchus placei TaxID=6290 RepID=A0A0N4WFY7_HAEPC|nr:unnamed protein product [Haemonchus placei]
MKRERCRSDRTFYVSNDTKFSTPSISSASLETTQSKLCPLKDEESNEYHSHKSQFMLDIPVLSKNKKFVLAGWWSATTMNGELSSCRQSPLEVDFDLLRLLFAKHRDQLTMVDQLAL